MKVLTLVFFLLLAMLCQLLKNTDSLPLSNSYQLAPTGLQMIPHRDGYIPVFIRIGDTPLENINPQLAEAFQYHEKIASRTTAKPLASTTKSSPKINPNQASLYKLFINGYKLKMNATNYRSNDLNDDEDKSQGHIQKIYKIPIVSQKIDEQQSV